MAHPDNVTIENDMSLQESFDEANSILIFKINVSFLPLILYDNYH